MLGFIFVLALGGTGCSSADSSSVGYLVGPTVAGVEYETPTQRGVTDREGQFRYEEGERVRFLLGQNVLGETVAVSEVTPFELTGAPRLTGTLRLCDALGTPETSLLATVHPCYNYDVPSPRPSEAFNALVNLIVLLQTLDDDGDPGNGIEITPEVRALTDDAELDLTRPWEEFREDFAFRRVIGDANERGLFSRIHGAINPAPALQQLYDALGLDPDIHAVVLASSDYEYDGIDGKPNSIERMEYNEAGHWTRMESDDDVDGVVDWALGWEYDVAGNRTFWDVDGEDDQTWEYDELGHLVRHRTASGNVTTYERDQYGSITRRTRTDPAGGDFDTMLWTYDEEGRPISSASDVDGDGEPESTGMWAYDADGNEVRAERDSDADGVPDWVVIRENDENGNLIREQTDEDGDGVFETVVVWHYEYDRDGNRTRRESDVDGDGTPESIETWDYDDAGNMIRATLSRDIDGDGQPEVVTTEYEPDGRLKVDGVELDEDGNPIRAPNGTFTHIVWTYDAGNLVRQEEVFNSNGLPLYVKTFQHARANFGYVVGNWPRF